MLFSNSRTKTYDSPPEILTRRPSVDWKVCFYDKPDKKKYVMPDVLMSLDNFKEAPEQRKAIEEIKDEYRVAEEGQTEADRIRNMTTVVNAAKSSQIDFYSKSKLLFIEQYYVAKLRDIIESLGTTCTFYVQSDDFSTGDALDLQLLKNYLCDLGYQASVVTDLSKDIHGKVIKITLK